MKMAWSTKAENRFGQMLICLRMSRLDFVVKETPYSAYITIRKKFVKGVNEDMIEESKTVDKSNTDEIKNIERENKFLKSKVYELEKVVASLTVENEESEIKVKVAEKDKASLEDDVEDALAESRELRKALDKISADKSCSQKRMDKLIKEKDDTIRILEFTIENKEKEIHIPEAKQIVNVDDKCESDSDSDSQKASTSFKSLRTCDPCTSGVSSRTNVVEHVGNIHTFNCDICGFKANKADVLKIHKQEQHRLKCDHCDFAAKSKDGLNLHLEDKHKFICKKCNLAHNDETKHKIHICREEIENPTFKSLYTRHWLDQNGCNGIYCSERNEEVIWLHSEMCWIGEMPCSWTPYLNLREPPKPGAVKHFKYSAFVKDNKICWSALLLELNA